jgi:hypothetical protein
MLPRSAEVPSTARRLRERSLTYGFANCHCPFLSGSAPAAPSRLDERAARLRHSELR